MGLWEDPEWDKAAAEGKETYWWVYRDPKKGLERVVKRYTPALAALASKRTGWRIEPVCAKGEQI